MPPAPTLPPMADSIVTEGRNLVLDMSNQLTPGKPKVYRAQTITIRGIHEVYCQ